MESHEHTPEDDAKTPSFEQHKSPLPDKVKAHKQQRQPASASASSQDADQLTILAHELSNILDGSLRSLSLAQRALPAEQSPQNQPSTTTPVDTDTEEARRKLEIVRQSLCRMAEIVDAAMRSTASSLSSSIMMPDTAIELGEAIFHAVDVLTPIACEKHVQIKARVSNGLSGVPAGPLYPVIVNGLSNAIDSVAMCPSLADRVTPGLVEITAQWTEDGKIQILILDEGIGLPDTPTENIFQHGFSTKLRHPGVGLAVARAIVDELPDSSIQLRNRTDRHAADGPGAIFEVTWRPASGSANSGAA